jgi:hypothetical protein
MNGGIASGVYRPLTFQRKLVWSSGVPIRFETVEHVYNLTASPADILTSAGDETAIEKITKRILNGLIDGGVRAEDALYVIAEADNPTACKIGYSYRPIERLMQLQLANWRKLKLHATFFPVKAKVVKLEQAVHQRAAQFGYVIRGEWLCLSPKAAVELIAEVADERGDSLCGPDIWLENLAARVNGLRKAQMQKAA